MTGSYGSQVICSQTTAREIEIDLPEEKIRYDVVDSHLHFTDFLEETDGFPALVRAMDAAGVSKSVIFGMGIAKQWDQTRKIVLWREGQ